MIYRPRCRYCGDTLHWLGAGWGHDSNNMATCLLESERQRTVMRLVEMGQLRIGPDNHVNKQAVMRLLNFDRPEPLDAD